MRPTILFTSMLLILAIPRNVNAQAVTFQATGDNATGWSPFGSYNYGDFDSVDLANGSVNLKINFAKMTTRGHTSHYEFEYSSKMWSVYPIQHPTGYSANWQLEGGTVGVTGPAAGWMQSDTTGSAIKLTYIINPLQCFLNGRMLTVKIDSNYVYQDVEGAKHNFPNWRWHSSPPVQGEDCGVPTTPYLVGYSSTNSGAYLDITSGTGRVSFPSGNYSVSGNSPTIDPNGNTWTQYTAANGQTFVQTAVNPNTGGRVASVQVLDASGAWQTYAIGYGQTTTTEPFPNPWNGGVQGDVINTLTSITLPNSQVYQFQYQATAGELTKVILPTGGYIRYEYTTVPTSMYAAGWATLVPADGRYVTKRAVSPDGTSGSEQVWTYAYSRTDQTNPSSPLTTTVNKPDGSYEIHHFTRSLSDPYHETSVEYHAAGGGLMRTVSTTWVSDSIPTISEFQETPLYSSGNYRVSNTTTTLDDGQQSAINLYYDTLSYTDVYGRAVNTTRGNVKKKEETAFGQGAPGAVARVTKFQYLYEQNSAYLTPYIINPLVAKWVGTPANTLGLTEYGYDTTTPTGLHGNLSISKAAVLVAGAPNPDTPPDSSVSAWISQTNSYDTFGNLTQSVGPAPKSYTTTFEYNQCNSGLLSATNYPVTGIREEQTWNCNIGQITQRKDANLKLTNYQYSDPLRRLTRIDFPDQGYEIYTYNDSTRNVTAKKNIQLSPLLEYVMGFDFDQLGRPSHRRLTSAPEGTITTDTTYDNLGRIATASNPYLTTSDTTYGITTNQYDALGRTTKVIPPDGTSSANNVSTAISGNCATVTDQAGKIRKSCSDALGRLIQVFEPNSSNALVYETDYQYDVLDNVIRVDQKGNDANSADWRTRLFTYNSLSQLTQASNPESGTLNYVYDNDGNLQTKTDARSIAITYSYDGMHRLVSKSYSNGDSTVMCTYDQAGCLGQPACANVGRRTGMTDAAGSEAWSYDVMGRPLADQRTTNGVTKTTISPHTTGGFISQLTYPSTRAVTYSYDAGGRMLSGIDSAFGINYATGALYSPGGGLGKLTNGASLLTTLYYNNRLQPCRISVKSSGTAPGTCTDAVSIGNVLDFTYNFSLGTADNGNVAGITNNRDTTRSQTFTYDALNRLATAQTTSTFATSPAHCWGESFVYDSLPSGPGPWGNLTNINVVSTNYNGCTQENLNIGVNGKNQITSPSGYVYDLVGNLTAITGASYSYNAENEMTAAAGVTYTYDGDGRRVKKSNGKLYWYGSGSEVLDETDLSGNLTSEYVFFGGQRIAKRDASNNVDYYFGDHLGSSRVVTNATGTVLDDSDFYPFGHERSVTGPTSGNSYKFTGKERDTETGLDYFGARYYGSSMGRFMSPDWSAKIEPVPYSKLDNPQSLNLYSYTLNNPLSNVDTDGHACSGVLGNSGSGFCTRATEYGQIDANPNIQSQTRFFAAANAVSQGLADVAAWGPGVRKMGVSAQTSNFLEGVGENLQKLNESEASAIQNGSLGGPNLDQQLVHNEQSAVQGQLDALQQSNPGAYKKTVSEINGALNPTPGSFDQKVSSAFPTDKAFQGVLNGVRKDLGRNIDFSKQGDREAIGNALIKHVRQTGGCDVNGKKQGGC